MTALIFIWYLLTTPADRLACSLWVSQPPSQEALISACGFTDLGKYRLDVIEIASGQQICTLPANALLTVHADCALPLSLDHYRLRIVEPEYSNLVCSLMLEHDGQITDADVAAQCPAGLADWNTGRLQARYIGNRPVKDAEDPIVCAQPVLTTGSGLYDQVNSAEDLATDVQLTWLAGRLIWFGKVTPECAGGTSGLDPDTLAANPCGMAAARERVTEWQNQFDAEIYAAAIAAHVPARLLKRLMMIESQFWPLWSNNGDETGTMQITDNGVDVLLRFDPSLFTTYPRQSLDQQHETRLLTLNSITCWYCSLRDAVDHTRAMIPMYARLLAAYRCRAVELNAALGDQSAWRQAVIDYNGSPQYLGKVEQQ